MYGLTLFSDQDPIDVVHFQKIEVNSFWVLRIATANRKARAKKPIGNNWSYSATTATGSSEKHLMLNCNNYVYYFKVRTEAELTTDGFGTTAKGDILGACEPLDGGSDGEKNSDSKKFEYDLKLASIKIIEPANAVFVNEYVKLTAYNYSDEKVDVVWSASLVENTTFSTMNSRNEYVEYTGDAVSEVYFRSSSVDTYKVSALLEGGVSGEASVAVIEPNLVSLEITSDHEVEGNNLMNLNDQDWEDAGPDNLEPEWFPELNRNNPVSHNKGKELSVKLSVVGIPENVSYRLKGVGAYDLINREDEVIGERSLNFDSGSLVSNLQTNIVTIVSSEKLINNIHIIDVKINWELLVEGEAYSLGDTGGDEGHRIYLTWDTPSGSVVTEKRIYDVCYPARTLSNKKLIADAIFDDHDNEFYELADVWGPANTWNLHEPNQKSQCPGLARFLRRHFEMIGIGSGVLGYGRAEANGTYRAYEWGTPAQPQRIIRAGENHPENTVHDDISPTEELWHPGTNRFEAFILFEGYYYALSYSRDKQELGEMLKEVFGDPPASWKYKALDDEGNIVLLDCNHHPWQEQ